jgi:hypothetical protein
MCEARYLYVILYENQNAEDPEGAVEPAFAKKTDNSTTLADLGALKSVKPVRTKLDTNDQLAL